MLSNLIQGVGKYGAEVQAVVNWSLKIYEIAPVAWSTVKKSITEFVEEFKNDIPQSIVPERLPLSFPNVESLVVG